MRADWPSGSDKPKWQRPDRDKLRYSICKICRLKWNIAISQDTLGGTSAPDVKAKDITGETNMRVHNYPLLRMPRPRKMRKGLRISSEPLFMLTFYREADGEECLAELTQKQIVKLLEGEGVKLIHLQASIDETGKWRKKEVRP